MARALLVSCLVLFAVACVFAAPVPTLDGTWTDSKYGGKLFICIDERWSVWGSYSEAGVLWGKSTTDKTQASGTWYEAGNAPCNYGTWEAYFANESETGGEEAVIFQFRCNNELTNQIVQRIETRLSSVANDEDCLVVYEDADFTGSWGNRQTVQWLDACENSGNTAELSIVYAGNPAEYFWANGTSFEDGRLFSGNFYSGNLINEDDVGVTLFFPISQAEAVQITWTGAVDYTKRDDPAAHRLIRDIQFRDRLGNKCADNIFLNGYVSESSAASLTVGLLMLIVVFVI